MRKVHFVIFIALLLAFTTLISVACKKPSENTTEEGTMEFEEDFSSFTFTLKADDTYEIGANYITTADIVIPTSYNGKPVTSIQRYAFKDRPILSVSIPSSIKTIGEYAFADCTLLSSLKIASSLLSIKEYAFQGCSEVSYIYYDGTLNDWCGISFENVYSVPFTASEKEKLYVQNAYVDTIAFSSGLSKISKYAFYDYEILTSVSIPSTLSFVGESAFSSCSKLKNVYYQGTWEKWFNITFEKATANPFCNNSTQQMSFYINNQEISGNLVLSEGIRTIKDYTLYNLPILSVTLPSTIQTVGGDCATCPIVLPMSITCIEANTFTNVNRIYYAGTKTDYQNVTIKEGALGENTKVCYYSENMPNNFYNSTYSNDCWHYDQNGTPILWSRY